MYAVFFYCDSKETKIQIFIYAVENRVSMCTQTHTTLSLRDCQTKKYHNQKNCENLLATEGNIFFLLYMKMKKKSKNSGSMLATIDRIVLFSYLKCMQMCLLLLNR